MVSRKLSRVSKTEYFKNLRSGRIYSYGQNMDRKLISINERKYTEKAL